jgi:DNA-binding GntR family transcriptional regulator
MARRPRPQPQINLPNAVRQIKQSTSDIIFETLREAILIRELPAGTPLVEAQLSQQFGVSKTPVREALQRLTHTGLVDFELARGARVHTLTRAEIADIWEMRAYLEPLSLKQSAPHLSPDELAELDSVLREARTALDSGDFQSLSKHNNHFHQQLYSKADNHLLLKWLGGLSDLRRLISMQGWAIENRSLQEWNEHTAILDAVKAGDCDLAAERLAEHIRRFGELVTRAMPDESDD